MCACCVPEESRQEISAFSEVADGVVEPVMKPENKRSVAKTSETVIGE